MQSNNNAAHRVLAMLLGMLVLAGCSETVDGTPTPARPLLPDVTEAELAVVGAADGAIDTTVRNALTDLDTFWSEQLPAVYQTDFEPLDNGYASVDPDDADPDVYADVPCLAEEPDAVVGNAFYCVAGDNIAYDRTLLESLSEEFGRFLPALVLAHEFGHAIQARTDPASELSIVLETQADCFAGAWTSWVSSGAGSHIRVRRGDLDDVVRGFLLLRDEPGSTVDEDEAHGSYFDRVSAFQEGFDGGVRSCRDTFNDDRLFTLEEFSPQDDGTATYEEALGYSRTGLEDLYERAFTEAGRGNFNAPVLTGFDTDSPDCGDEPQGRDLAYCAQDNRVLYDEADLVLPIFDEIGDFAVGAALSIPYALAAREALGLSVRGSEAIASAVCAAGWFTAAFYNGDLLASTGASLSPGDVDEAILFLVDYGSQTTVLPDVGLSGFQLVDVFRGGFLQGAAACDLF